MNRKIVLAGAAFAVSLLTGVVCHADGLGADMWTYDFHLRGLYTPHIDYCDSGTEAFVPVGGTERGFCIDKNEQSAVEFQDARGTCADAGKRLPEPVEFKVACINAGSLSLSNMTNNNEWVSNYTIPFIHSGGAGINAPAMGSGGCSLGSHSGVITDGGAVTRAFRCVR